MKRKLSWALSNGIFAAAIYFGLFKGVGGALNIAVFIGWFSSICVWLMLGIKMVDDKKVLEKAAVPSIPKWIDRLFDVAVLLIFVYHGYYVLGAFYAAHIVIMGVVREIAIERLEEIKESEKEPEK